ncbi:ABC transporter substrate-binding protein [Photobacterium makurazakiensis]|uniref:ABC transporter substrate-binding protein n=1 Tax=Photobacterium makurazakiensis TaxID=2910234 RepID=UPI003D09D2CD
MKLLKTALAAGLLAAGLFNPAFSATELVVQYPYGPTFDPLMKELASRFEAENDDIKITYRTSYENYEDASQRVMREAITKRMPDISFQGLNRIRPLMERDIAISLDDFLTEDDRQQYGYGDAMMSPARFDGKTWAFPFAISLPVAYYNMDLVRAAQGNDSLPTTWDGVIELAQKVNALDGKESGLAYDWHITGSWLWLAPMMSQGGKPLDDNGKVAFNNEAGQWTMDLFARMTQEAKAQNYSRSAKEQSFVAGNMGIYFTSTGSLSKFTRMAGDNFELKTGPFPDVKAGGTLPVGGNAVVMLTKDQEKQQAAWQFIRFITGPEGNALVSPMTGYMSPNPIAAASLTDFLEQNPNYKTVVNQLPLMDTWHAFPGRNGLKITDVISDHMESIFSGRMADKPQAVNEKMAKDVQKLLPRS